MFGHNNNKIEIEKLENGYVLRIIIAQKEPSPIDMVNQIMPAIERIQNKAMGDDWKNHVQDEIDGVVNSLPPKPVREYICKTMDEVFKMIKKENF